MSNRLVFRLTFPILTLTGLLVVIAGATGWFIHRQQQAASHLLQHSVASMRAAEELEIRMREMRTRFNQFVVTGDMKNLLSIPEMFEKAMDWLRIAEDLSRGTTERALTHRIRQGMDELHASYERILALEKQGTDRDELKRLVGQLIDEKLTAGVLVNAHEFLDVNQQSIQRTIPVNQEAADRAGLGLSLLGLMGGLAGLLAGFTIARNVSRSIVQLRVPVHDAAGKLNEVVGPIDLSMSGLDIDSLGTALQSVADHVGQVVTRLQKSQREALRAEQLAAVGQLAAGMAHELRNPLTAIKMIVQNALEEKQGGGITGRALSVLHEQILRQERSIQVFLEFAKPPRLEAHEFDLSSVVGDCVQLLSAQANRQQVKLLVEPPASAVIVCGDAQQLRQVILNLILNAMDALASGGTIEIRLSTQNVEHVVVEFPHESTSTAAPGGGTWAVLAVSDNGPGLPDDLGDQIFEPFISTKETGMGLGLSICKRIVDMHLGFIQARNRTGGGATFFVFLPVATKP